MKIHIRNGRLVDPKNGIDATHDLYVAAGRVVAVGNAPAGFSANRVIDATGKIVCPGLVDLAVRLREPGGRTIERTFKSGDSVEGADVVEVEMQYLYNDGDNWHFMNPSTFEQLGASAAAMEDARQWLKGEETCLVMLWNGVPLSVQAPNTVVLEIVETDPGMRGDTPTGGTKPATLETGAVVKVPLFVEQGTKVKVDTRLGEYVSRA